MPCKDDCGLCCEAIALRLDDEWADQIRRRDTSRMREGEDSVFLAQHFTPMTREAAQAVNPWLVKLHDRLDETWPDRAFYWTCDQYDAVTKRCRSYDTRPRTCSQFPFYGNPTQSMSWVLPWETCGYWEDARDPRDFGGLQALIMAPGAG